MKERRGAAKELKEERSEIITIPSNPKDNSAGLVVKRMAEDFHIEYDLDINILKKVGSFWSACVCRGVARWLDASLRFSPANPWVLDRLLCSDH